MYRILVIEDDFSLAQIIKRQIESWGHAVRLVTDFQHVIPTFVQYDPHMVLISRCRFTAAITGAAKSANSPVCR